jgi:hypothetical protein
MTVLNPVKINLERLSTLLHLVRVPLRYIINLLW